MKKNTPKTPQKSPKTPRKGRRTVPFNTETRVEQPKKGRKSYNRQKDKTNTLFPEDEGGFGVNW